MKNPGQTWRKKGDPVKVHAWIDRKKYEKGRKITDEAFRKIQIARNQFYGDWNYEIHPRDS